MIAKSPKKPRHKYEQTTKGKEAKKRYNQSAKGKAQYYNYKRTLKGRFTRGKDKAKRRGIAFKLTYKQFVELSAPSCYYCNEMMDTNPPPNGTTGLHLDRIDNDKGYTKDNVVSCCFICNSIRNDFLTVEETKVAVQAILEFRITTGVL